jgi:hypothetical protein
VSFAPRHARPWGRPGPATLAGQREGGGSQTSQIGATGAAETGQICAASIEAESANDCQSVVCSSPAMTSLCCRGSREAWQRLQTGRIPPVVSIVRPESVSRLAIALGPDQHERQGCERQQAQIAEPDGRGRAEQRPVKGKERRDTRTRGLAAQVASSCRTLKPDCEPGCVECNGVTRHIEQTGASGLGSPAGGVLWRVVGCSARARLSENPAAAHERPQEGRVREQGAVYQQVIRDPVPPAHFYPPNQPS